MIDELKDDWQAIRITDYYGHNIIAPSSWEKVLFSDICRIVGGSQPPKECFINEPREGYIRLIQIRDYKTDKFATYIPIDLAKRFCNKEDIMIGRYGPPIFQILRGLEGAYNVALMKAEPNTQLVIKEFLYYFLKTSNLFNYIAAASLRTAGQDGVRKDHLDNYPVFIPPLNEQKRIVAEIEALRERSQKARSALSAIPELCNKFRQSILAAAFRGDLTADWREQNPDVEPASVLLERIKDDRYKDWELEQLAKASHRSTKLDSGKLRVKYELPTSPQEDRLFRELEECIPDSWAITSLDSVARLITGKTPSTSEADYWDGEIPFVTPTEIDPSGFILPSRRLVTQLGAKQAKTIPSNSTLIVCIGTVGKVGILSNPSVVNQQINALVSLKSVSYKFIYYWAQALKPWIVANAAATVNAAILNKSRLGMAPIPIPPYLEQLHIVSMIEAMLSETSSLTSNITNAYEWLNSLDRSILAKAFRGELVEQDPNDEPASVLLDRIRVDREQQAQGKAKKLGKKAAGNKL